MCIVEYKEHTDLPKSKETLTNCPVPISSKHDDLSLTYQHLLREVPVLALWDFRAPRPLTGRLCSF